MALQTTRNIKRQWSNHQQNDAAIEDFFRVLYEEFNSVCDALAVIETLANELRTDGTTNSTFQTEAKADIGVIATWEAEVDGDLDDINDFLDALNQDGLLVGDPAVQEGTGDTTKLRLAGTGLRYQIDGQQFFAPAALEVEPPTGEITGGKYGCYRMELAKDGTLAATRKADPMAYDSEEDAVLSLGSLARTADSIDVGYVAILAAAGGFTAQTDLPIIGDAQVDGITWWDSHVGRYASGLNSAVTVAVANGVATLNISAVDVNVDGKKLSQIAAAGTQAMDDADTVGIGQWGGWLLVVDPAGTGTYALASDGIAGTVSAMTHASQAAADTALDLVQDRLPTFCVPIARIYVNNVGGGDAWTAGTDNWDHDTAVASATVYPVIHSRVADDTYSIIRPTVPATVTAPAVAAMSATPVAAPGSAAVDLSSVAKMSTIESG
jgi:hypothetical protein